MTESKTALVTGASGGIGREFARLLAADGFTLVLVARDEARLSELAEELRRTHGVQSTVIATDLSEPSAARDIHCFLQKRGVSVDVLVNNAGFNVYGPFHESDGEQELRMLHVNVIALTHLTKLFLPEMLARGRGRILNLGSTGSFSPGPRDAVYCASKAYVLSFSEALAEELAGTPVTVTALCPGPTATRFAERAGIADIRLFEHGVMAAADVAAVGYRALMRGRRVVVPGIANKLMTFSIRFSPRRLVTYFSKILLGRKETRCEPQSATGS